MKLSTAINEHIAWFHSRQDTYYSWFMDDGKESLSITLAGLSGLPSNKLIEVLPHSKYILDNSEYSFLLVGVNGVAEKLSPAFELSDENTNVEENEAIPSNMINAGAGMETVRWIPANSSYEFPLRNEQSGEAGIDDLFLGEVDALYERYFATQFPAAEAVEDGGYSEVDKIHKQMMVDNLALVMVSLYYSIAWGELVEECRSMKNAYEIIVQETALGFLERAFEETKEELEAMLQGEDSDSK